MNLFDNLNQAQREAVVYNEGPLLVLAGAGTGKTRVITYKIAYLISKGVNSERILALTFTNKACKEMLERVRLLTGNKGVRVLISTFHSFCLKILKNELFNLGRSPYFVIYDESDQLNTIKEIIKEKELEKTLPSPKEILYWIQRAKDNLIDYESFLYHSEAKGDFYKEEVAEIYRVYQEKLKKNNAYDFGDLIMEVVNIFREKKDILEKYEDNFDYILVDEYQDTNFAQYTFLKLLARRKQNLTVVGDEDQAIYSWRGATMDNVLKFEKDWKGCKIVKLEKNYRSKEKILHHATMLINNNRKRYGKKLYSVKTGGFPVMVRSFPNCRTEAMNVVGEVLRLVEEEVFSLDEIAIFYRTNAQSRILEEVLRRFNVNYELVGTVSFYERKEIKDVISFLVLLINPQSDIHFLRVVNIPPRGLGKTTIGRLKKEAFFKGISIYDFIKNDSLDNFSKRARTKLKEFVSLLNRLKEESENKSVSIFIRKLITETGYFEYLDDFYKEESEMRKDNVGELISAAREFEEKEENITLKDFLDYISLITPYDEYKKEGQKLTLMTLHLAKGLEFDVVFITGLEEGILPYRDSLYDPDEMEEERRLCYVGMTRAKERLYLTCALERTLYGMNRISEPSRFLEEAGFISGVNR